jgi:hypothetical protein
MYSIENTLMGDNIIDCEVVAENAEAQRVISVSRSQETEPMFCLSFLNKKIDFFFLIILSNRIQPRCFDFYRPSKRRDF